MNIIVQKYGGSSVANKQKLEKVMGKIISSKKGNNRIVVVVSAQGKTTNKLIEKASKYSKNTYNKEMDLLLSIGEIETVSLLTMMLKDKGCDAVGLTGSQAGVITDSNFGSAKIKMIMSENILKYLDSGKIVVVAGFQGVDKFGNITTLGRGGSDLSAVAIAASLKAKRCEIYTDVDGVYTADPNIITSSKLINKITYDEMLEAASSGAKVLHNRAVSIAKKYKIKVDVKNTVNNSRGTQVTDEENIVSEDSNTKILAIQKELAKITIIGDSMYSNMDYITKIYNLAKDNNIQIYIISLTEISLSIIVNEKDVEKFSKALHEKFIIKEK